MYKKTLKTPKGGNQNPYIEEQTTKWSKENKQNDKQRSTRHTHKTKDRVTRTPLNTGGEPTCSEDSIKETTALNVWTMQLLLTASCNEISYEGKQLLSLLCLTKRDTDRPEMHMWWMTHLIRKSVWFSKGHFFVCHFIRHDKLSISTPVLHHSHYYYLIVPSKDLDFQRHMSWSFYGQWIEVRGERWLFILLILVELLIITVQTFSS